MIEETVTIGVVTCPECSHEHRITLSVPVARQHAGMILAAVDGLRPVPLGAKGGSDA